MVRDLTTKQVSLVHTSRLQIFRHPTEITTEEVQSQWIWMSTTVLYETIVAHEEKEKNPKNWKFKVKLVGYESEEDT